ncbi:10824_t:CDS:2 [Diversispora eburnea]|uniref:10824_t:CDS:1 n=2 Tax=Diversisporales TaxID=214509 RepID=A0A9N8ZYS7_9GLOM|nr:10824_t:CDS:2 [Diversispora eburnea]
MEQPKSTQGQDKLLDANGNGKQLHGGIGYKKLKEQLKETGTELNNISISNFILNSCDIHDNFFDVDNLGGLELFEISFAYPIVAGRAIN